MKLSQAIGYFSTVNLEGWDGEQWYPDVAQGSLESYDRAISQRNLGRTRRILKTVTPIEDRWQCVRFLGGESPFILATYNVDVRDDTPYNHIYQIDEAPYVVEIVHHKTSKRASGSAGPRTDEIVATTYGGYSRATSQESETFETVNYSRFDIEIPIAMKPFIDSDAEIQMDGARFNIIEYSPRARAMTMIAARRSG